MNYSKWDKFAAELSDSDEETATKPTVKIVGDNQSVKIGPDGYQLTEEQTRLEQPSSSGAQSDPKQSTDDTELALDEAKLTTNGSKGSNYYWRQDRSEVILTVLLPADVKGKEISVLFDTNTRLLRVVRAPSDSIFSAPLRYTINTENMVCNSSTKSLLTVDAEDWEIVNLAPSAPGALCVRVLELTLRKLSPLPGAIFWWRNCFEGEAEIDVTKIAGRTNMGGSASSTGVSISAESDPFVQAQKLFLEKMKSHEKVEVDLSEP